jgi:uncharacterized protein YcnI
MKALQATAACALLIASLAASSHPVLEQPNAAAGSSYRATLRIGHGCDGLATTGISVRIPAGVQGAKPVPKPGWVLAVASEALAAPYTSHGKQITADVVEISWSAASKEAALPDAYYDEFVLRATLPAAPGALWFKVIQTCEDGGRPVRKEWTQVPEEGTSTRGLALPAALLQVEPAAPPAAHH